MSSNGIRISWIGELVKVLAGVHLADMCGEGTNFLGFWVEPEFVVALRVSCENRIVNERCDTKWGTCYASKLV